MATTSVTLPEQSVTYDPNAAPDAVAPGIASPYGFSSLNTANGSSNGSFANTPITTVPEVQTTSNPNTVSPGDLPWAIVLMPTTSAGQGGIGNNRHALQPETWVYGVFMDGDDCQQPLVVGVVPGAGGGGEGGSGTPSSGTSSSSDYSNVPAGKINVTQNMQTVYDTLRKGGFTHEQACGIMGNAAIESGFRPNANNNIKGGHWGIWQWDRDRWGRFQRMFPGRTWDVQAQTQYLVWELNNTEGKYGRLIKMKEHDVTAAAIGMANSERFGGWNGSRFKNTGNGYDMSNTDLRNRIGKAKAIAAKMQSNGPARPSSTPSGNTTPSAPSMTNAPLPMALTS